MADLSDSDKKILLGTGYREDQAARDVAGGITDETRRSKARESLATDMIMGAFGVGALALLIAVTNFYSMGTPYNQALVVTCLVVAIASGAVAVWFMRSRRSDAAANSRRAQH